MLEYWTSYDIEAVLGIGEWQYYGLGLEAGRVT